MALPRLSLLVGAGMLLTATSAFAQGGDLSPPAPSAQVEPGAQSPSSEPSAETAAPETSVAPSAGEPGAAQAPAEADTAAAEPQTRPPEPVLQLPFVTVDQARLFNQSLYGARLSAELGDRQAELAAENRRIEGELADKEKALTERRAQLNAEEFRRLADEFNGEVERYRAEQAGKEREIYQTHERNRALFQDLANQAMAGLLRERGALAIIAEEAIVLGFRELDITEDAVKRLDALVGDGSRLPQPGQSRPGPEGSGQGGPAQDAGNQKPDQTSD